MLRLLGQDAEGCWHVTVSSYTTTMHTKCDKWLKVIAFSSENTTDPRIPPTQSPWCTSCVLTVNLEAARTR